jgi:hypothetical protein
MDMEKSKQSSTSLAVVPAQASEQSAAQIEAKKQLDKFVAERKAAEELQKKLEQEAKKEAERQAVVAKALKEAEQKKKQEAEKNAAEASRQAEQKKLEEEQAKRKAIIEEKTQKLNQELDQFSVTLNKKHFNNAVLMQNEVREQGYGEIPIHVHASEVYKKSFTFPQIAHNDFAVEQLESLSIAE